MAIISLFILLINYLMLIIDHLMVNEIQTESLKIIK